MEIWKDVKGFEGIYSISNLGNVKRVFNYVNGTSKIKDVSVSIDSHGYKFVMLHIYKKDRKLKRIHQLLAESFLNHMPCGYKTVVDHIDNNPLNNDLSNLQLITHRQNTSKDNWRFRKGDVKSVGVTRCGSRFYAVIHINGRKYSLGAFKTELEASDVYKKALEDYHNGCFDSKKYNQFKPSSQYKNVSWHKGNGMWQVVKRINGKYVSFGYFHCEIEASLKAK